MTNNDNAMDYKLSTKNKLGKWWQYGSIKTSPKGYNQASFKVSALKELIELAGDKEWVNLSLFDNVPKPASAHSEAKSNGYAPKDDNNFDMDNEIQF